MTDYNIVNIPTDFSIVQENVHKLNFINDVAIFYDKTRTHRNTFGKYANFNVWLDEFCKLKEINFWKLRSLLKPLILSVENELIIDFKVNKSVEINLKFKRQILDLLIADKHIYYELMRSIWSHLPIENNYTLIASDGQYLMSKNFMIVPRYFHNIEINEFGLFKCEIREIAFESGRYNSSIQDYDLDCIKTSSQIYYWDSQGHFLNEYNYKTFVTILKNSKIDHRELLKELDNSCFKVVGPKHNSWKTNIGENHINWGEQREDGLLFYSEEYSRPGSDSYTDFEYVGDAFGRSMYLNDFYCGLKSLKNGAEYLNQLKREFVRTETNLFI
jgi:hypothetical protein